MPPTRLPSGRVARPRAAPVRASLGFGNRVNLPNPPNTKGGAARRRAGGRVRVRARLCAWWCIVRPYSSPPAAGRGGVG